MKEWMLLWKRTEDRPSRDEGITRFRFSAEGKAGVSIDGDSGTLGRDGVVLGGFAAVDGDSASRRNRSFFWW